MSPVYVFLPLGVSTRSLIVPLIGCGGPSGRVQVRTPQALRRQRITTQLFFFSYFPHRAVLETYDCIQHANTEIWLDHAFLWRLLGGALGVVASRTQLCTAGGQCTLAYDRCVGLGELGSLCLGWRPPHCTLAFFPQSDAVRLVWLCFFGAYLWGPWGLLLRVRQ
jgi:hypothetical protein